MMINLNSGSILEYVARIMNQFDSKQIIRETNLNEMSACSSASLIGIGDNDGLETT